MAQENEKMVLSGKAVAEAEKACAAAADELLPRAEEKRRPNLVGVGVGVKWKKGAPTGEPAVLALVTTKVERDALSTKDLVPPKVANMQTDVLAVGIPLAGDSEPPAVGTQTLGRRIRPAEAATAWAMWRSRPGPSRPACTTFSRAEAPVRHSTGPAFPTGTTSSATITCSPTATMPTSAIRSFSRDRSTAASIRRTASRA